MSFCSHCGNKLTADDKFCRNCGKFLDKAPTAPAPEVAPEATPTPAPVPVPAPAPAAAAAPEDKQGLSAGLLTFSIINTVLGAFGCCFCNPISLALGIWGIIATSLAMNKPVSQGKNLCKMSLIVNIIAISVFVLWIIFLLITGIGEMMNSDMNGSLY
ncbi:MAG: zinc ribbon domain-containing protein [Clostridia bacterium]|nr:zinc ribbon domain-containing protein [Clostridia bacterium]